MNDIPSEYTDNKGEFDVTVKKITGFTQTSDPGGVEGAGNTVPRPIPGVPANTQLTVTLINNEQWVRTATLNIDGKVGTLEVAGNKAISKAYKSTTGKVTISLVDSQQGAMRLPVNLDVSPLGATGKSMTFGAEKPKSENRPGFMDVFVHIDWNTDIIN